VDGIRRRPGARRGTLGQIPLNPPGQLCVTTRIPFTPNEGANELRCLLLAAPFPPPSRHFCLLPREKRKMNVENAGFVQGFVYFTLGQLAWRIEFDQ
jgi:hypothetical protein